MPMAQTAAKRQPAGGQTIEAYVGETMDNARMGPIHWRVLGLVASGYFFDVIDFTIFGALVPDIIKSGFATAYQVSWIGFATLIGLGIGTLGQGEFTDRFGRKAVYQFNLLLFGLATIAAALPAIPSIGFDPGFWWVLVFRFIAGIGLGAEQPLCFSYTAEYAPKNIRGRIIALMQFIGGAWPWPVGLLLTIYFRDTIGWRGIWVSAFSCASRTRTASVAARSTLRRFSRICAGWDSIGTQVRIKRTSVARIASRSVRRCMRAISRYWSETGASIPATAHRSSWSPGGASSGSGAGQWYMSM